MKKAHIKTHSNHFFVRGSYFSFLILPSPILSRFFEQAQKCNDIFLFCILWDSWALEDVHVLQDLKWRKKKTLLRRFLSVLFLACLHILCPLRNAITLPKTMSLKSSSWTLTLKQGMCGVGSSIDFPKPNILSSALVFLSSLWLSFWQVFETCQVVVKRKEEVSKEEAFVAVRFALSRLLDTDCGGVWRLEDLYWVPVIVVLCVASCLNFTMSLKYAWLGDFAVHVHCHSEFIHPWMTSHNHIKSVQQPDNESEIFSQYRGIYHETTQELPRNQPIPW